MGSVYTKIGDDYVELNEKDLESADSYAPALAVLWIIGVVILAAVILVMG